MHFSTSSVLSRADRFLADRVRKFINTKLSDVDILIYEPDLNPTYKIDGKDNKILNISEVLDIYKNEPKKWKKYKIGDPYGSVWGTTYFKISTSSNKSISDALKSNQIVELLFDLGWYPHSPGFHIEGLAYTQEGVPFKALHPLNGWLRLTNNSFKNIINDDGSFCIFVEVASNPLVMDVKPFVETDLGDGPTYEESVRYRINNANLSILNEDLYGYSIDLELLIDTARLLYKQEQNVPSGANIRAARIAFALENSMNLFDERDIDNTLQQAKNALKDVLSKHASESDMTFYATGHAHIDTAWLWPYRETRRKTAKTIANVLALMDIYPNWTYSFSAAQHYAWLEEDQKELFDRLTQRIREGRIVPVGGAWVESDGVIPTGESLVRQHLYGQRYFKEKFGIMAKTMWLPDSFGYSSAFPTIGKRTGFNWFLTQKISWGDTTKFPHHSFYWQGLDGTRIFTHFPPSDTYNASVTPAEMHHGVENYQEKAVSDCQLMLFGYGDGGGGPTREMIERANRLKSFEGNGKVEHANPNVFFEKLEKQINELGNNVPLWSGDFYLEFHRGTLTSQRAMKKGNRRCESLLRTAEYLATYANIANRDYHYPSQQIETIFKKVLTNQFHDVLPGSSIAWAHRDAKQIFEECEKELKLIINNALDAISKKIDISKVSKNFYSPGEIIKTSCKNTTFEKIDQNYIIKNSKGEKIAVVNKNGHITDFANIVLPSQPFGALEIFDDKPTQWDAWDIDRSALKTGKILKDPKSISVKDDVLSVSYEYSKSTFDVNIYLGERDVLYFNIVVLWNEDEKLLKFNLPINLNVDYTEHETQYGTVKRPVYSNTSADEAKFETAWHRFLMVKNGENVLGIINDCVYGVDTTPINPSSGLAEGIRIRPTLLKSAKFPDPNQDQGKHSFTIGILPYATKHEVLSAATCLNAFSSDQISVLDNNKLFDLENITGNTIIDWVKGAENRLDDNGKMIEELCDDIIVRLYEPFGNSSESKLIVNDILKSYNVSEVDMLEANPLSNDLPKTLFFENGNIVIKHKPYSVTTLRFSKK